jgi:hypothetical protein
MRSRKAAKWIQVAKFRREFFKEIYSDVCADLDVSVLHSLHQRRVVRRVRNFGDYRYAIGSGELRPVERLFSVISVGEEAHSRGMSDEFLRCSGKASILGRGKLLSERPA